MNIQLHEATLSSIESAGSICVLVCDDAVVDGEMRTVRIAVEDVSSIVQDGVSVSKISLFGSDADILSCRLDGLSVEVVVECKSFAPFKSRTTAFNLFGGRVVITVDLASKN